MDDLLGGSIVVRMLMGLVVLAALSVCTLIPGTPVNNDPSPQAVTAGIHLSPPAATVRAAAEAAVSLRSTVAVIVALALVVLAAVVLGLLPRADRVPSRNRLLLARSGRRRGPPALLS